MSKKKSTSMYGRAKKTVKLATISLALGGIIGTAIGMLTAPKKGKELCDDLEREGERIWKQLKISKAEVEKVITKVFGEVSPERLKMYTKAKSEILARVVKYKKDLNKTKYNAIVDTVMKNVSKSKTMQKPLADLGKEFKKAWVKISKNL